MTRCPIRDIEEQMDKCPVDLSLATPEQAKEAMEKLARQGADENGSH
jgi:hypothetical protein